MKKRQLPLPVIIFILALVTVLYAAGSAIVESYVDMGNNSGMSILTYSWTSDDSTGNVYTSSGVNYTSMGLSKYTKGKYLIMAETNPTDSPTDNYDAIVRDTDGVDIFAAALANCDTTNSEQWLFAYPRPITGELKLEIVTAGNAKHGVLRLIMARQR